ncbi:MAG: tRNA uridine-5-carboxymethylaminomethyl(34) synthesis GTPase MnmE [Pseudomonadota bacterium]
MTSSTIAAIATPAGRGGIGIVRISGPQSFSIGSQLFRAYNQSIQKPSDSHFPFQSHRVYFGQLLNFKETAFLDEVLIIFMKAPKSYTREDVVEIQCHAGHQVLKSILNAVFDAGAIPAEPGEFTKRAYLNGRIDLTQSEAVIDLINARSEISREIAFSQISGNLKNVISGFQEFLTAVLAQCQAEIEFSENVTEMIETVILSQKIQDHVIAPIEKLIHNHEQSFFLTESFRAIIIGAPNVGKSSLMNCLARKEKSIVTPHPGTTRDLIEEYVQIQGTPTVLADTAGLHESEDPVEAIGIEITLKQIHSADLILFVLQAGRPLTKNEFHICKMLNNKQVIFIFNKTDLTQETSSVKLPYRFSAFPSVHTSALKNIGIDTLEKTIEEFIAKKISVFQDPLVPNIRQKQLLLNTLDSLSHFIRGLSINIPLDLLVIDLIDAIRYLNEITGKLLQYDILDQIFNKFCIGK